MHLKEIIDQSRNYYREPSMVLISPECTWKCSGCKNFSYAHLETKDFPDEEILKNFSANPALKAIVIAGLEPMENVSELRDFIFSARKFFDPEVRPVIVIYTGYYIAELEKHRWSWLEPQLMEYGNVILKCGRYEILSSAHLDPILGVYVGGNQIVYDLRGYQHE